MSVENAGPEATVAVEADKEFLAKSEELFKQAERLIWDANELASKHAGWGWRVLCDAKPPAEAVPFVHSFWAAYNGIRAMRAICSGLTEKGGAK